MWWGAWNFNEGKEINYPQSLQIPTLLTENNGKGVISGKGQHTPTHRRGKAQGEMRKHQQAQFCRDIGVM